MNFNDLLSKEAVFSKVSSYQIIKFYIPIVNLNGAFSSPWRKDTHPSCSLFFTSTGTALIKDFANGEVLDGVSLVMKLKNVDFYTALNHINNDMGLNLIGNTCNRTTSSVIIPGDIKQSSRKAVIRVKYREWNDSDVLFWGKYNISISRLIESDTYPIDFFWIGEHVFKAEKLSYVYHFYKKEGIDLMKIYQPYSDKFKWVSNIDTTVVDGIKNIDTNCKYLIITKSRKDRLTLNSLGYNSIATNNETSFMPLDVFEKLHGIYDDIYILFDNDEAGNINSKKFSELYNLIDIKIQDYHGEIRTKDISDLISKTDVKTALEFLTKTIKI